MNCPCKSNLSYDACCKPFHDSTKMPHTAEQLMRSRFSAYALNKIDYIMKTTDKSGPQYDPNKEEWEKSLRQFAETTAFQNLTILEKEDLSENEATVTFHVTLTSIFGEDISYTEKSLFKKRNNMWLYHGKI